ncbi:hypothetical protein GCM10012275_18970 [Longimycelium tulufanense]|uniref:Secreted protein n=1 Tax=Longimycelium tulufanense TaxID=907463 RepID=A0A8J3CCC9_9PSEU|nr:hypothetical protein GCM10012275_18970 [Longimycelium tulufanense]
MLTAAVAIAGLAPLATVTAAQASESGPAPTGVAHEITEAPSQCDGGGAPPDNVNIFVKHYYWQDNWLNPPCQRCKDDAIVFAFRGFPTWCWDHGSGGAELWIGHIR